MIYFLNKKSKKKGKSKCKLKKNWHVIYMIKCKGWSIKVYMNNVYLQVNGLASMIMLIDYNNVAR